MNVFRKLHFVKPKAFVIILLFVYLIFFIYTLFQSQIYSFFHFDRLKEGHLHTIYIIGKAAIAQYLWQHLLNGNIDYSKNGFYQTGNKTFSNLNFVYLSGPGYIQYSIPQDIEFIVLVLNGRSLNKVIKAKEWLDYLHYIQSLKKVAVVLLGNEKCENEWIVNYLKSKGGIIDVLFLVYDSKLVDDFEVIQWPLGIATYRGFPNIEISNVLYNKKRRFKCNFMGTIYKNSSRELLNSTLRNPPFSSTCYVQSRSQWVPEETHSSLKHYIDILQDSDLTLCPVGINSECYRIYEALSLGSIPVVEDSMTPGKCVSPLRLLKRYNAPFIYVKDWNSLPKVLDYEVNLNYSSILQRRKEILYWYQNFKTSVASEFVNVLKKRFMII